jgi:hypothetical protein
MTAKTNLFPWKGYLLLPPSSVAIYRGVDRTPFDPVILESEIDISIEVSDEDEGISPFYPLGWRRRAYRLYEENRVKGVYEGISLLTNIQTACEIKEIIEPHVGYHEIIGCEIYGLENNQLLKIPQGSNLLGFDIAYPGGDFYSAILNGLFINPAPLLLKEYFHLLNAHGLFISTIPIKGYLSRFRQQVPSESESEFCIYKLYSVGNVYL